MKDLPHLIGDTADLVRKITRCRVPVSAMMWKIDIRDFFMSGLHENLVALAEKSTKARHRKRFRQLLEVILEGQIVRVKDGSDEVQWVRVGSGMGLVSSDEISSNAFYLMCEKDFALDPSVRAKYDILLYLRFKDDIFVIFGINSIKESRM